VRVSDTLMDRRCRCNVQPVQIVRVVDCNEDRISMSGKIQLVDSLSLILVVTGCRTACCQSFTP